ncbi:MAG: LCP family protein [Acidobacteria bacterium]|nr:LCP family protein [Acidobacteriota bacterium]
MTPVYALDTLSRVERNHSSLRPLPQSSEGGLRQRLLLALVIFFFAGGAAYGALILMTRVDSVLFPGSNIDFPIPLLGGDKGDDADSVGGRRINVLVMGLDRRPREGDILTRTDTIMVLTIDPQTKTAGILGIPRDLYVEIPNEDGSYFKERVNTALEYGELYDYPGGGRQLAKDTIKRNLGIDVDYYVIIDFGGFEEVIDSLGGINVDVPEPLYDPYYSDTELPGDFFPLDFDSGYQHMEAKYALGYARSRYNSSDLDRIQRQQRVIFAVMDKALSLDVLPNALDLWQQFKHTIDTDISDVKILGFAKLAADLPPERISALSLGPCTVGAMIGGMSVLLPSEEGCKTIVDALFLDQELLGENAVVEVRDASGAEIDMSEAAVDLLVNLGFPDASVIASEPLTEVVAETEIIDFTGKSVSTSKLAAWLGVPPTAVRSATALDEDLRTTGADIVVVVGSDAKVAGLSSDSSDGEPSQ